MRGAAPFAFPGPAGEGPGGIQAVITVANRAENPSRKGLFPTVITIAGDHGGEPHRKPSRKGLFPTVIAPPLVRPYDDVPRSLERVEFLDGDAPAYDLTY